MPGDDGVLGGLPAALAAAKTLRLSAPSRYLRRKAAQALESQKEPQLRLFPWPYVQLVHKFVQMFLPLAEETEEVQDFDQYWIWAADTPLAEVEAVEYAAVAATQHATRRAAGAAQPEPVRVPVQGWKDGDTAGQLPLHLFALQAVVTLLLARALAEETISDGLASLSAVTPVAGTRPGPSAGSANAAAFMSTVGAGLFTAAPTLGNTTAAADQGAAAGQGAAAEAQLEHDTREAMNNPTVGVESRGTPMAAGNIPFLATPFSP
jgi:hypothetical protein